MNAPAGESTVPVDRLLPLLNRAVARAPFEGVHVVEDGRQPGRFVVADRQGDLLELGTLDEVLEFALDSERCVDCGSPRLDTWEDENGEWHLRCLGCETTDEPRGVGDDLAASMAVLHKVQRGGGSFERDEERIRGHLLRCGWCEVEDRMVIPSLAGLCALAAYRQEPEVVRQAMRELANYHLESADQGIDALQAAMVERAREQEADAVDAAEFAAEVVGR